MAVRSIERRETERRAAIVQAVVDHIVLEPQCSFTVTGLCGFLHVPRPAAERIALSLVHAGVVKEVSHGVWSRVPEIPFAYAL
jgi:hypothetical protein